MPPSTAGAQSASCAPACCAPSGSDRPDPSCWTCPDKSIPYPPAEIRRPCSASKKFLKISFEVARAGGLTCWTEEAKGGNRIETSTCGRTAPKTTDCCWCGLKSVSCKARKVVVSFKFSIRRSRKTYSHRSSCTLIKLLTCNNPHKRSANIEKKRRINPLPWARESSLPSNRFRLAGGYYGPFKRHKSITLKSQPNRKNHLYPDESSR